MLIWFDPPLTIVSNSSIDFDTLLAKINTRMSSTKNLHIRGLTRRRTWKLESHRECGRISLPHFWNASVLMQSSLSPISLFLLRQVTFFRKNIYAICSNDIPSTLLPLLTGKREAGASNSIHSTYQYIFPLPVSRTRCRVRLTLKLTIPRPFVYL